MDNLLKSIVVPAVLYKANEQLMILNDKASKLLKNNISIHKTLENMLKHASKRNFLEYLQDIHIIGENENLVSFYCIQFDNYYLIMIQDISITFVEEIKMDNATILKSTPTDIVVTDGRGIILSISPNFDEFYGATKEEVLGKNVLELEKSRIFYPSATAKVLKTGKQVTMIQKNKLNHQILVTAIPFINKAGDIYKVACFSYDVADLFKIEDQFEILEQQLKTYKTELKEIQHKEISFPNIIGKSKEIQKILKLITKVADFNVNILLTGESGVGKTSFAKLIHSLSKRSNGPLIELNCGAIPEHLLESELFGFEGGSFTGAKKEGKLGLIELAKNGTLFLDEISELPLNLQVKILKVIQDKTVTRVGGTKPIKVDFRLITATNEDLKTLVEQKKFREDLFYRLNVLSIHIPPLRNRKDDIFYLSLHFVEILNKRHNLNKKLSPSTIDSLIGYDWMGNIRELENIIERAMLTSEDNIITEEFLPEYIRCVQRSAFHKKEYNLQEELDNFEKEIVLKAYKKHKTTVGVAKALGISQATAVRKIKKYISY